MKALINPKDDRILGFTMIGPEGGEVMAVVQTAMLAGSSYTVLRDAIFTHPTMAEGLNLLFSSIKQAKTGKTSPEVEMSQRPSRLRKNSLRGCRSASRSL